MADTCEPKNRVYASVYQIGDGGYAFASASELVVVSPAPSEKDGDCALQSEPTEIPEVPLLDMGSATLIIDGGDPIPFPDGSGQLELGNVTLTADTTLDPAGGEPITVAWTGGPVVPASSIGFTTPVPLDLLPVAPMVPGEPWTLAWNGSAEEHTSLDFALATGGVAACFANGDTITVPGTVTALVDPVEAAEGTLQLRLIYRGPVAEDLIAEGVAASGVGVRLNLIDLPPASP